MEDTDQRLRLVERIVRVWPDAADVYSAWRSLVVAHAVRGVQVHDARLVAWMQTHGVTHLLTLNKGDFARFPGIIALAPADVIVSP